MQTYLIANGAMQTTAAFVKVTTGTAIKTLLQLAPITPIRIVEWGISFDGSASATPIEVELIETDVAATVTAYGANDITKQNGVGDAVAFSTYATLGTAASGFTASAEGATTAVRNLAAPQLIAPTTQFIQQFPLGREPVCQNAKFARIRVTAPASVFAYCYLVLEV